MTPKEKAAELIEKFKDYVMIDYRSDEEPIFMLQKQCALIVVEEILNNNCGSHTDQCHATYYEIYCDEYYWNEVKQELTNL